MERIATLTGDELALVARAVDDGITLQDPGGALLFANEAAARIVGYPSAEALLEASPEEVLARLELFDERGAPLPPEVLPPSLALRGTAAERLLRVRVRATGHERWTVLRSTPVLHPDGRLKLAIHVLRDITERKLAEAALRARQRFIADAVSQLASSLDPEGTLQAVARLAVPHVADWCAIDLLDGGEIRRVAAAHVDPAKVELAHELARRYPVPRDAPGGVPAVLRTGRTEWLAEVPDALLAAVCVDGEQLRLARALGLRSCVVAPMIARGRTLGAITFVAADGARRFDGPDVELAEAIAERAAMALDNARLYREATQARAAAEASEAALRRARNAAEEAASLGEELVGIVSHDLRSPLGAILMAGSALRRAAAQPELARVAERVVGSAERMHKMIDQLLDFTRARVGAGLPIELRETRLDALCLTLVDELRTAHPQARIELEADGPLLGLWDGDRLAEVLTNLVGNAVEHGSGAARVRLRQSADEAVLEVHNDGEPIPDDELPRIFDPFRRGRKPRSRDGLGLGLYIAQHIVAAHGGAIAVRSSRGDGTTFTVRLPLRPPPDGRG